MDKQMYVQMNTHTQLILVRQAMTAKQTSRWTNQTYVQMNTHSVNTSTTSNARTNKCLLKTNIQMKAQTNTQNE